MTTHVLLITDKSGSMAPVQTDVRGGYNTYLDNLSEDADNWSITSVLFDTYVTTLCEAAGVTDAPRLTVENYQPGGNTALLDAVGTGVTNLEKKLTLNEGDKVLVVIQTDGEENSSREWSLQAVQDLIQRLDGKDGWGFLFIGQGPGSWDVGRRLGTMTVNSSSGNMSSRNTYGAMAAVTRQYAGGQTMGAVGDFLKEEHRKGGTLGEDKS